MFSKRWSLILLVCPALFIGCEGAKPVSPSRFAFLNVSVPVNSNFNSSLIGSTGNTLLYRVDGPGMGTIKGTIGPFTTAGSYGSVDFNLEVPTGPSRILSLQLNDAPTAAPLAVGAAKLDFLGTSDLVVEMGSVTRNCYYTYTSFSGSYAFLTDATSNTAGAYDIAYLTAAGAGGPATIYDSNPVPGNIIAYLGNGNLVDYDFVPPDANFATTTAVAKASGPIQIGDIFCVKLNSTLGAHAWIQITNPGNGIMYQGPFFRFRVNTTQPCFAYERTQADVNNVCSPNN